MKPGMVVHTYNPSYLGGQGRRTEKSRLAQAKLETKIPKNRAWAQLK
jgi:hypothetical protein